MKKAIEIEELRISSNGEHLEFIINCPADYRFTEFTIQVGDEDDKYSVADSLFYEHVENKEGNDTVVPVENEDNRFIGQIPVSLFGVSGPAIYKIYLEAKHRSDCVEHSAESCDKPDETIYAKAYISDVSHVYQCLVDDILSLDAKCTDTEAQDRVIRNYLILYAHQEALRLGHIDEATKWFYMMDNCFSGKCGCGHKRNINLGCGCRHEPKGRPAPSNCGCRR